MKVPRVGWLLAGVCAGAIVAGSIAAAQPSDGEPDSASITHAHDGLGEHSHPPGGDGASSHGEEASVPPPDQEAAPTQASPSASEVLPPELRGEPISLAEYNDLTMMVIACIRATGDEVGTYEETSGAFTGAIRYVVRHAASPDTDPINGPDTTEMDACEAQYEEELSRYQPDAVFTESGEIVPSAPVPVPTDLVFE